MLRPEQSHGRMEPTGMIHTASLHVRLKGDHSVSTSCAECVAYNFFLNSCLLQYHGGWPPTLQLKMIWLVHSGYMAEAEGVSSVQLEGRSCLPVPGHLLPPVLSVKSCWNVWLSGHPWSERGDASRTVSAPLPGRVVAAPGLEPSTTRGFHHRSSGWRPPIIRSPERWLRPPLSPPTSWPLGLPH